MIIDYEVVSCKFDKFLNCVDAVVTTEATGGVTGQYTFKFEPIRFDGKIWIELSQDTLPIWMRNETKNVALLKAIDIMWEYNKANPQRIAEKKRYVEEYTIKQYSKTTQKLSVEEIEKILAFDNDD